jgi:hypothetical protein
MTDAIDPHHYNSKGVQPIEYIMANQLDFCEGAVIKYVTRHKEKNGAEDIKKAIKFCEFILKYHYPLNHEKECGK